MSPALIARSRINSIVYMREHHRKLLGYLLRDRLDTEHFFSPAHTDALLSYQVRLLGGMAAPW